MSLGMAAATKTKTKKPQKSKPTPKAKASKAAGKPPAAPAPESVLDDVEEPDRSSPAMAEVDAEALEFIAAIDRFKKENGRPFPSWSEVLLVLRQLGYRRR